ncbi:hypothetical protein RHMOL_Rhmol08G0300800 [Rhododendron molle]|uniref:Uncharacterized protein n=1 Tax=Rhododendron molle TaxID=49168 RepID=A0ACC0MVD9_RHOML|nr:hypothetical protein RHMOL_Rhmol08G0300800 [Rhododendron molle]
MLHCSRLSCRSLDVRRGERSRTGQRLAEFRKIENGRVTLDAQLGHVVRSSGHFRSGISAEPYARFLSRLSNFGHPFAPTTLTHSSVNRVFVSTSSTTSPGDRV